MGQLTDRVSPRKTFLYISIIGLTAVLIAAVMTADEATKDDVSSADIRSMTVLSQVYDVDQKYRSMMGPSSTQEIFLGHRDGNDLVWITGYKAVMVGADGMTPAAQEFMCHSNLDIDPIDHHEAVGASPSFSSRLFTLSQGQLEVDFPSGFGIPVLASEALELTTQVLNHNIDDASFEVRHKVSVKFIPDGEAGKMTPLFPVGAYGLALLEGEDGYFGVADPNEEDHGPSCLPRENAADHVYRDGKGRAFTGHWVVPPGREVNRTLVTELMRLPYDTTVHYIAVHLHPFAESLELVDLTTGETVFKSRARNFEDKIGLAHVDSYSSPEGLALYKDHEYQMVSVYNNTTDEDQDSMAVMYMYLRDKVFDKSQISAKGHKKGHG